MRPCGRWRRSFRQAGARTDARQPSVPGCRSKWRPPERGLLVWPASKQSARGCGAKIGSKAYLTTRQLCDESGRHAEVDELFKGRHFDREIIVLCVRWYLRHKLSFRDLAEMMAERALSVAHTAIMRWIQRYVPEFERRWNRFTRPAWLSWRVDETYVKSKAAGSISTVPSTKRERPSISCCAPSGTSQPPRHSSGELSAPRADCRIRSRPMAIRPLIARPKRLSANIRREIDARSGRPNTSTI